MLDNSGTKSGDSIATAPPQIRTLTNDHSNPIVWSYRDGNAAVSLNVTVKLKWNGNGVPTAPPKSVLIQASAFGTVYGYQNGNPSASNGFSDLVSVVPNGSPYYGTSASTSGKHIVKVPANSGTEIIVGSWSLSASGTPNVNTSFSAAIDPRDVFITSNIEPNYRRSNHASGQGQRIQNVRNPDGNMVVDCLAPLGWLQNWFPVTITYSGTATGWSALSCFQWKAALGIQGGETFWSGYFYPLPLYDAIAQYLTNSATPGSTEHISLTITDSTDGAVGKALYDVRFHDKYEPPVGQVVVSNHPLSPDPLANTAEWTFITESVNYTSVSLTTTVSFKVTHTEGWELSLNGETVVPPLLAQVFTGVTVGGKMSNTISKEDSYSQQVTTPPNRRTMFFQASPYATKTGYCSQWNYSGFASDVPFSGRVYSDVAAVASVEKPL